MNKLFVLTLLVAFSLNSFGQWGNIQNHYKKKTEDHFKKKGENIGKEHAEEAANNGIEEAEKAVMKYEDWEDEEFAEEKVFIDTNLIENSDIQWQRLRFITGQDIIFYDKPFNFEKEGEAPSNWYIKEKTKGTTEVGELDQGKAILVAADGFLTPKVDNVEKDYLSNIFTFEFDFMIPITPFSKPMNVNFFAMEKQDGKSFSPITLNKNKVTYKDSSAYYPILADDENGMPNWFRLSVAFDNGLIKVYLNERLMITYKDDINPTGISVDYYAFTPFFFKNFMIATNSKSVVDQIYAGEYISYNINYISYKNKLDGRSISDLSKIGNLLKADPEMKMAIEVYFSQLAKEEENEKYGKEKSLAIENALLAMGVGKGQIEMIYKGFIISEAGNISNKKSEMVLFRKK